MKKPVLNPLGNEVIGLYNAKRINILINKYNKDKIDLPLFKIYRSVADPNKAVVAQFVGNGAGAVENAKPVGLVYDKPLAKVKTAQALDLFGKNSDEIIGTINDLNKDFTVDELISQLKLS